MLVTELISVLWLHDAFVFIRAGPRHVDVQGRLIRRFFKPIFFKHFRPQTGLAKLCEVACSNCVSFWGDFFFAFGNLSLPASYFRIWKSEFTSILFSPLEIWVYQHLIFAFGNLSLPASNFRFWKSEFTSILFSRLEIWVYQHLIFDFGNLSLPASYFRAWKYEFTSILFSRLEI